MTHPDTLQIPRAVVEQALEAFETDDWQKKLMAAQALRAALQPQDAVTTSGPPERDNSKPAEQQGVFRKFNVQRTDGSDQPGGKHHGCEYFVLDVAHDQHAKPALEAYAVACATTHPQLSADMRERYGLQAQAAAEPVAWLIEYVLPHLPPQWAMLRRSNCLDFTDDANRATRFSRREDAQAVLDQFTGMEKLPVTSVNVEHYFKVTEHMWAGNAYTTPPATQAALTAALSAMQDFCTKCDTGLANLVTI